MTWPASLEEVADVSWVRRFYGVSAETWESFTTVLGDPGEDLRVFASVPKETIAEAVLTARTATGQVLTAVQGTQLGLSYRLANRKVYAESGRDLAEWKDPDPWALEEQPAAKGASESKGDAKVLGPDRKMKFVHVLDQSDESEFHIASEVQKQAWLEVYVRKTGGLPLKAEEPSDGAAQRLAAPGEHGRHPVCGLQRLAALRQEGVEGFEVPGLYPHSGRVHHQGDPRPFELWPVAGLLEGLPVRDDHPQLRPHLDDGGVRVHGGEAGQAVPGLLALGGAGRGPGQRGASRAAEGEVRPQRFEGAADACDLVGGKSLRFPLEGGHRRPELLAGAGPCSGERLAGPHLEGEAAPAEAVASATIHGGLAAIQPETETANPGYGPAGQRRQGNWDGKEARKRKLEKDREELKAYRAGAKTETKGGAKGKTKKDEPQVCYAWNNGERGLREPAPGRRMRGAGEKGAQVLQVRVPWPSFEVLPVQVSNTAAAFLGSGRVLSMAAGGQATGSRQAPSRSRSSRRRRGRSRRRRSDSRRRRRHRSRGEGDRGQEGASTRAIRRRPTPPWRST